MIKVSEVPVDILCDIICVPFELKYDSGTTYLKSNANIVIDLEKPNVKKIHVKGEKVTLE